MTVLANRNDLLGKRFSPLREWPRSLRKNRFEFSLRRNRVDLSGHKYSLRSFEKHSIIRLDNNIQLFRQIWTPIYCELWYVLCISVVSILLTVLPVYTCFIDRYILCQIELPYHSIFDNIPLLIILVVSNKWWEIYRHTLPFLNIPMLWSIRK